MKIVKDKKHILYPVKPKNYGKYAPWLEATFWFSCAYCLKEVEKITVDHLLPKNKYKKGLVDSDNLLPACHECQEQKGSYDPNSKKGRNGVKGIKLINISTENLSKFFKVNEDGELLPIGRNHSRQIATIALLKLDIRPYLVEMRSHNHKIDQRLKDVLKKKSRIYRSNDQEKIQMLEETIEDLKNEKLKNILLNLVFEYDLY